MHTNHLANCLCRPLASGILLLLLSACAADAGSMRVAPERGLLPAALLGLPPVPSDLPGTKDAAALHQTIQNGADAFEVSSGATISGTQLVLPAAANAVEYGMYAFAPGSVALKSITANFNIAAGEQVWLGVADYGPKRWKFQGPYPAAGVAQFDNLDAGLYLSQGGKCYLLIVAFNATTAQVSTIQFTTDDAPPAFSLSGLITVDPSGDALSGVALTLEPGGSMVVSDSDGNYIFTSVTAGQYQVTPALAGYTFDPPFYNLDLQGLATDVDFTATPDTP